MVFSMWTKLLDFELRSKSCFSVRLSFFSPVNRNFLPLTIYNNNFRYYHLKMIKLKVISSSSFIHPSTIFQLLKPQVVLRFTYRIILRVPSSADFDFKIYGSLAKHA